MARACPITSRNGMAALLLKSGKLGPHDRLDLSNSQRSIDHSNSIRVFARQGEVPFSDPLVKVKRLGLDPVPARRLCAESRRSISAYASSAPRQPDPRVEIQQDSQIRSKSVGSKPVQQLYQVEVKAPSKSLIRERRIGKTVTEHHCPSSESRLDQLPDKLRATGLIQQQFRGGSYGSRSRMEQKRPDLLPDGGPAGIVGFDDLFAGGANSIGQQLKLGRLTGPLAPLKGHKYTAHLSYLISRISHRARQVAP